MLSPSTVQTLTKLHRKDHTWDHGGMRCIMTVQYMDVMVDESDTPM